MSFRDRRDERTTVTTKVTSTTTTTAPPRQVPASVPVYEVTWDCEKGWSPVMLKGYTSAPFAWYKTYGFKGSGMCIYASAQAGTPPAVPHYLLPCEGC